MIQTTVGNLLDANVDALVNPVNTQGVMGKGLALPFKRRFPEVFSEYKRACNAGDVVIGHMHIVARETPPRFVINLPTKQHWHNPSRLKFVSEGLVELVHCVRQHGIQSLALPPLRVSPHLAAAV